MRVNATPLSGGNDKMITLWRPGGPDDDNGDGEGEGDIGGGGMIPAHHTVSPGAVRALAVTADGARLFTAGADKNIRAWDISHPERGIILLKAFKAINASTHLLRIYFAFDLRALIKT